MSRLRRFVARCSVVLFVILFGLPVALSQAAPTGPTLGDGDTVPIAVVTADGSPICHSFSFSQMPQALDFFVGRVKTSTARDVCGGPVTLALFRFDWASHVMTMQHLLMQVPASVGAATIDAAYDPSVAEFGGEAWVAFECAGRFIAGTSTCVAPLAPDVSHLDLSRLSIPIVGLDSDGKSPWWYSASTPKLLNFKDHLYLYWTAIQIDKAPPHRWNSIETRGSEMMVESGGARSMWVTGHPGRPMPSHAPGANMTVMAPITGDPYRKTTVDTEGVFVNGNSIIVLSSVGGEGPDDHSHCTRPLDKSPGCFHLEITQTSNPLGKDSFLEQTLVAPVLPANPMEYPRIVTAPNGQTYLMAVMHNVQMAAAPTSGKILPLTGYTLTPLPLSELHFVATTTR